MNSGPGPAPGTAQAHGPAHEAPARRHALPGRDAPEPVAALGEGAPLPGAVRSRMEAVVGGDLSDVRVHTGASAGEHTSREGALATTWGRHLAFAAGVYRPGTPVGEAVLAHELAHARQQEGSGQGVAGGALEGEADRAGYLAVLQLLDPGFTARAAPLTLSTGQGLQLQRCTAPHYGEIRQLPSREEYEQRGELSPKGFPELADLPQGTFVLDLSPRPPSRPAPAPPDAEEAEHDAPPLEYEQLVDRLNILEARQRQIDELITDVDPGLRPLSGSALMRSLSGGTIGMARLGLSRPGMPAREPLILVMPGYSLPTPEQTVPRDPVELSRKVAGADVVQRRVLEMLPQLKIARENEVAANSELEGYELVAALQAIDEVRRDYRDAADRVLTAQAPSALKRADERNAALKDILTRYKLDYYAHRSASGPEIQPSVNRINEWATTLQGDLADLDRQAAALQEARKRRDPKLPSLERAFSHDAEMVATSIEALGEWDSAVRAYEFLSKNTAVWGQKGVEKIAARLEQMRRAASDRDLPYLQLLLRDHRADTAVKEFYAALPQIVAWSHLIIGLVITLLVAIITAGVGIAISAAGTAIATAVAAAGTAEAASAAIVVLNATFWVKLGGEAFIFTFLSRQLNATIPGMEPKSPFWVEFSWNLGMFGVMHGASAVAKSLIGTYALTSAVAKFAVNTAAQFAALEAFGYFRFAVEEQRTMTVGEFGQMSAQNVIMMAAMTATMKPMEPVLKGLEGELTSSFGRFARRYGAQSADLATRRAALETAVKQRMESRPTAGMDDVPDLTKDARDLDADFHRLVDDVRADPTIDVRRMADELSGVMEKTAATTVLELLTGLDPAVDLQPTGDPTSWSFASGKGGQLAAFLRDGGYPVLTERSGGGVPAVIEAEIPGKGRVTFVERPADAPATPPAAPEAAAPPAAAPAATASAAVPAGDAPGPVPGSAAVPARVRWLIELSAKLARVRAAAAAERAAAEPAGQAGVDPESPAAAPAEASAIDHVEIAHRQAIDVAMQDARAEAGLRELAKTFQRSPNGLSRVLGAVPPENMGSFLRAAADPAFGPQEVSFFQALGRNTAACRLVEKYGGRVLMDLLRLQRGDTQAIRMAQSRADVDRVLAGLEKASGQPGRTPGTTAVEDLLAGIHRARQYTYRTLDKLVDPRPELQVRIEPDVKDPQWLTYERRAAEYARRHPPEGKPLSVQERQLRAALFQVVEQAWAGEYGDLSPADRAQMLELFDAVADATRLEDGWRSSKRGELNEALQLGTGRPSRPTAWVNGKRVTIGTPGSSELDHADPPVTDAELRDGSVLTRKRTWIERKDYNINSSDQAMTVAGTHYKQAVADLGNLPRGSTIAVEYARDYPHLGEPTLRAMADVLYQDPRIVRVSFAGKVIPRR